MQTQYKFCKGCKQLRLTSVFAKRGTSLASTCLFCRQAKRQAKRQAIKGK